MMEPRDSGDVCELTIEEKEYLAEHLNETDENRTNVVAEIRRWIQESDDLRARTDDFFILRFLRACKFNVEKTKLKIRNYHQQRANLPEWYMNRNPFLPEMQKMFNLGVLMPLRGTDENGRIVVIGRTALHDPYNQPITDLIKAMIMVVDVAMKNHVRSSINGVVTIIDLTGVSFGHALQLGPSIIRHLVHTWQGCYPIRIKSIIFINVPTYMNVILSIFKNFMNAKLKKRIFIYKNHNVDSNWRAGIPDNVMPVEYGGTGDTVKELKEYWKKVMEENRDWFADDEKYKIISTESTNK